MLVASEAIKIRKNSRRCSSCPLSVHCWQQSHMRGEINVSEFACAYPTGQTKLDHLSILKAVSLPPEPPKSQQRNRQKVELPPHLVRVQTRSRTGRSGVRQISSHGSLSKTIRGEKTRRIWERELSNTALNWHLRMRHRAGVTLSFNSCSDNLLESGLERFVTAICVFCVLTGRG